MALVPSPPVLIPELTGRAVGDTDPIRAAALTAAGALAGFDRWIVLGPGDHDGTVDAETSGSFAGYGVDVPVSLSPRLGAPTFDPELPLPALVAGWLRGQCAPETEAFVHLVDVDAAADDCVRRGRALRGACDDESGDWGLLVVADGATTLTARAPGSFDRRAEAVQTSIDDALAAASTAALAELDRTLCAEVGVSGTAVWQTLAGVVGDDPVVSRTYYRGAPFGVGYYAGTWTLGAGEDVR